MCLCVCIAWYANVAVSDEVQMKCETASSMFHLNVTHSRSEGVLVCALFTVSWLQFKCKC